MEKVSLHGPWFSGSEGVLRQGWVGAPELLARVLPLDRKMVVGVK